MPHAPSEPWQPAKASLEDQLAALELVYARLEPADRQRRIAARVAEASEAAVAGLWIGRRGKKLAAAMLAEPSPGATAMILPPRAAPGEPSDVAGELARHIVAQLEHDGVQIAQALLEAPDAADARLLVELGFRYTSELLFLVSTAASFPESRPANSLEFVGYSPALRERLKLVVEQSYVDSLDCPEVDGVRNVDDILTGYRAIGVFDPARWLLVREQQIDVGCLLIADHPSSDQAELVYMGVTGEARGRGLALAITRHAQWLARQAGRGRLVLAVDARNKPAIAAYLAANFVVYEQHSLFLRIFAGRGARDARFRSEFEAI